MSYFIHSGYQGVGLATELVRASLEVGFVRLNLPLIGAFARPDNVGSARVFTKCGFALVGYEPKLERNHYELNRANWHER